MAKIVRAGAQATPPPESSPILEKLDEVVAAVNRQTDALVLTGVAEDIEEPITRIPA